VQYSKYGQQFIVKLIKNEIDWQLRVEIKQDYMLVLLKLLSDGLASWIF